MLTCRVGNSGTIFTESNFSYLDHRLPKFEFDLENRLTAWIPDGLSSGLFPMKWTTEYHEACIYFDSIVGTPEKLMAFAKEKNLPKLELAKLLTPEARRSYLESCGIFEQGFTVGCRAKNEPCLVSGCAMDKDDACLNACLNDPTYQSTCVEEWIKRFKNLANRIDVWKRWE